MTAFDVGIDWVTHFQSELRKSHNLPERRDLHGLEGQERDHFRSAHSSRDVRLAESRPLTRPFRLTRFPVSIQVAH